MSMVITFIGGGQRYDVMTSWRQDVPLFARNLCDAGVIGNEFHYIMFKCKAFYLEQKLYIIQKSLRNMPSILEMHKLFNSRHVKILLKLVKGTVQTC